MNGLPLNQVRALAKILYLVPDGEKRESFNAAHEDLGGAANQRDNDFARAEQHY